MSIPRPHAGLPQHSGASLRVVLQVRVEARVLSDAEERRVRERLEEDDDEEQDEDDEEEEF